MRILIKLVTVWGSVVGAMLSGGAAVADPGSSCMPSAARTAWVWPVGQGQGDDQGQGPSLGQGDDQGQGQGQGQNPGQGPGQNLGREPAEHRTADLADDPAEGPTEDQPSTRAGPTVLRGFEPPLHRWDAGHRGVDLAGYLGDPVRAAGPGVVLYAGRLFDRGVVVVGHGVLRTSYEPVSATVAVGARVAVGQQIGTLDSGHCAGRPCLHWGLLTGRGHAVTYFDPLLLLGCGRLRLEPVMTGPGSR